MYFLSTVENARCCCGQTLGQAHRRMILINLIAFGYAIVQLVDRLNSPGDTLFIVIAGVLCIGASTAQLLINGLSTRNCWLNQNGRLVKYHLYSKLIYVIAYVLHNSLFKALICKDVDKTLNQPSCDYNAPEICVLVIWSLLHLFLLSIISTVCKYIDIENRYGNREDTATRNINDEIDSPVLSLKVFEAEIVEIVGIPYTAPTKTRRYTKSTPIKSTKPKKISQKIECMDLTDETGTSWKSPKKIRQERLTPKKGSSAKKRGYLEASGQQPDSEGIKKTTEDYIEDVRKAIVEYNTPERSKYKKCGSPLKTEEASPFMVLAENMFKKVKESG